jgi:serine/threonine-protein kinase
MQYKQIPKSIGEIGRELGADYILEGGVRRYGQRVRLTARLIAARDQAHVWADSFEVQLPPIFSLQQSLARQLVDSLSSELKIKLRQSLHEAVAPHVEAYRAYLEGRSYFLPTDEDIKKKLERLYLAIERDPRFARSYAELALVYLRRLYRDYPPVVSFRRIKKSALQALKLDPKQAGAHVGMSAHQLFWARNWPEAERSSRRAIELNPSNVWARNVRAAYHLAVGEAARALEELEQAHQLDPRSLDHGTAIALLTYFARDYDLAIKRCQQILQLDLSLPVAHMLLGLCYAQKGDYQRAVSICEKVTEIGGDPISKAAMACSVYAMAGQQASADRLLQKLVAAQENRYIRYVFLAPASVSLGNDQETLKWLEKAYEQHDPFLVFLKADPRFEPLYGHPRFRNLLRRIGLPR